MKSKIHERLIFKIENVSKKIILSATALFAFAFNGLAQTAPDFGFETWAAISPPFVTMEDPAGWASLNALSAVGTPQSAFKETVAPYAGTTSCRITTVKVVGAAIPNPFRPGQDFDTAGFVGVGKITPLPSPSIKFGYTLIPSTRPATLSFASKYTPVASDSAFVFAYLTHWNGSSRDTIAEGKYSTGASTTSYALNSLTMVYKPSFSTVWADTMMIYASSSIYSHGGAQVGSTFYVDNFSWSGYNSVNEIETSGNVSVFPNPATNNITLSSSVYAESVEIQDITGRKVGTFVMNANTVTIETAAFASGIYIYNVLNEKKEVINRGKFEVTK